MASTERSQAEGHGGMDTDLLALGDVPVQRVTLSNQIAERLIDLIGSDKLRAGDELPSETRLAAAFNVSRPVIREALSHLAALRMVELSNGRPARVMPVTPGLLGVYFEWAVRQDVGNILELHELRRAIESMCAELAATRATAEEKHTLESTAADMRQAIGSPARYSELDANLHMAIISCAHNALLRHLAEAIQGPLRATIEAGLQPLTDQPDRLERMQRGHEAIVEAILESDGAKARSLMQEHLTGASQRIASQLQRLSPQAPSD